MESNDQLKHLLNYVRTKEEVNAIKDALDNFLSDRFSLQENNDEFAKLPNELSQLLKPAFPKDLPIEKIKSLIEQLNSTLSACPIIHLTIAIKPTHSTIEKISSKVKQLFGQDSIIDITIDPNILGGIILIQNGKYQDLSVKKKLADAFKNKQEEINALLK